MSGKAEGGSADSDPNTAEFIGFEYHSDERVSPARYRWEGSSTRGWQIQREGAHHLDLGPGFRPLRSHRCGVCSTDLDRRFLPFPLPQIIGHEVIALDQVSRRHVVEINASHEARGIEHACPFCLGGLATHCPERRVLGIHDLPGGFGPWVLAPEAAIIPLPDSISDDAAVLIEPFAAALHAAESIAPSAGERVAVLGPRRLGLLVIAALAALRKRDGTDYKILGLVRRPSMADWALRFGADEVLQAPDPGSAAEPCAEFVIDTTGNPLGLETALMASGREVHLKSTHGQPSAGLRHTTELVVDELTLQAWPEDPDEAKAVVRDSPCRPDDRPRVAWLASTPPPAWLSDRADVWAGTDPNALLKALEDQPSGLPRADLAVVDDEAGIDAVVRPREDEEISLVRPRGQICTRAGGARTGPLLHALHQRKLRLSTSRCGDFEKALALLVADDELAQRLPALITHRVPATRLPEALALARTPECIKVVIEHAETQSLPGTQAD